MTKSSFAPPAGVFVPVPTFFKSENGKSILDTEAQIRHSIILASSGITGLALLGSTGESVLLSRSEKKVLITEVRHGLAEAGFINYPIMAGVVANSVDDAVACLNDLQAVGAQWGLVLAPGYYGTLVNETNLKEWYQEIADKSPIGILIYHYPGVSNAIQLSPSAICELATHTKIVGCKMSHGNMSHHIQVSLNPSVDHSQFRLYSGLGQQLFPVVITGGAGVIDGFAAICPKAVMRLYHLSTKLQIDKSTLKEIKILQYSISCAEEMLAKWGLIGVKEGVLRVLNIGDMSSGRLPMKGSLGDAEWKIWESSIDRVLQLEAGMV